MSPRRLRIPDSVACNIAGCDQQAAVALTPALGFCAVHWPKYVAYATRWWQAASAMSPSRICNGPANGTPPCPARTLVPATPGSKQASRCPPCKAQWQANRGTTTQRGYGPEHRRLRAQAIATYQPSDPCWRCGQPLGPDPSVLDLGHTDDRTGWMGLEHAACSRGHHLPMG